MLGVQIVLGWDYYTFNHPKKIPDGIPILCSQSLLGIQSGEAWQIEAALRFAIYNQYQYLLKSAGDIVIDNPRALWSCLRLIQDCDYLSTHAAEIDTKFFFARVLPMYRVATTARFNAEIQSIEVQYSREADNLGLRRRQFNHYEEFKIRHLQEPVAKHNRWEIGMTLERADWVR